MKLLGRLAVLALVLGGAACRPPPDAEGRLVRSEPATAVEAVDRWLTCTECSEGELAAVVDFGAQATPLLTVILAQGPDSASVEAKRSHLWTRWAELAAATSGDPRRPFPVSRDDFVAFQLDGYVAGQRLRAAHALGRIGGTDARDALQSTLATGPPARVADAISAALASM